MWRSFLTALTLIAVPLLTSGGEVGAGGCYHRPTYYPPTYNYDRVLIADAIVVPLYVIGFAPLPAPVPVPVQQPAPVTDDRDETIRQLREELEKRGGPKAVPQMPSAKEQTSASITVNKCATCHDKATAKRGGNNVFFDQGRLTASADQRLDMIDAILDGRMPKNGKMADDDAGNAVAELTRKPLRKGGVRITPKTPELHYANLQSK
jgi:hypothetical protein